MADRTGQRDPHGPGRSERSRGRQIRLYAALLFGLLALILIIQNSQTVEFKFFFANTNTPLFFGLLVAFILGALVGWLLPRVRRGRPHGED